MNPHREPRRQPRLPACASWLRRLWSWRTLLWLWLRDSQRAQRRAERLVCFLEAIPKPTGRRLYVFAVAVVAATSVTTSVWVMHARMEAAERRAEAMERWAEVHHAVGVQQSMDLIRVEQRVRLLESRCARAEEGW